MTKLAKIIFGTLLVVCFLSSSFAESYLPPSTTPGLVNKDVTQANYQKVICGKSSKIRPSASYTTPIKKKLYQSGHYKQEISQFELDHRVPICAGGEPTGKNRKVEPTQQLWLESYQGQWNAHRKDKLEVQVCKRLCDREITLHEAQQIFLDPDWTVHYEEYVKAGYIKDAKH